MDNLNDDRRLVLNAKISGKCVKIYVNMYHYLYLLWLILERMEIDIRRSHLDNLCKIIFKYKIITYNNFPQFDNRLLTETSACNNTCRDILKSYQCIMKSIGTW